MPVVPRVEATPGGGHVDPIQPRADAVASDEATSWADDTTHEALQVIAEGITELAGFEVAAVSVLRDGTHLQVMAVAGSLEARDCLMGTFAPMSRVLSELEHAYDWGCFKFIPEEEFDPSLASWSWVPDLEPIAGPDAWRPMDLLLAPLYDSEGQLLGTLSIDCPCDGRRPGESQRRVLNWYAEQASQAILVAIERQAFAEQVRMLSATREVVRDATRERDIVVMLQRIQPSLIAGFRSQGAWINTFDEDGHGMGAVYAPDGSTVAMPPELMAIAERTSAVCWQAQRVGIISARVGYDDAVEYLAEQEFWDIVTFLDEVGVGSLMFVPMGAGRECLGNLVLVRGSGEQDWSLAELDAAFEVGRDLGRAVMNARASERERELVRELKALDDYKSKLIATLSHELKSPLAAMLANIEFLEQMIEVSPDAATVLGAVDRGASRLVRVVDDLLLLAKVGDSHLALLPRAVPMRTLVDAVVNVTSISDQHRISVRAQSPDADLVASGDRAELEILVTNLVGNAVKYSPEATEVVLTMSRTGDEICLECSDQGIGIAEQDQQHLFREFFRADTREVRAQSGTGLGLTIVDRIVTRHGGRISVDSELGRGSTFRVVLPAG